MQRTCRNLAVLAAGHLMWMTAFAAQVAAQAPADPAPVPEKAKEAVTQGMEAVADPAHAKSVGLSAEAKLQALQDPKSAEMGKKSPDLYRVRFETTKGNFVIEAHRDWSPHGADRFYNLVRLGHYDDARFFRVVKGFMVQFGIGSDPKVNGALMNAGIPDDPVKKGNTRGRVTYAKSSAPNSRTTQVFINFGDNSRLDAQGFAAFGEVVEGMDVVDALNGEYGDGAPRGKGPEQGRIQSEGNAYLKASFPRLDSIKKATIVE